MNIIVKSAIAGALALSASGAYALGVPALNSSDLVLVIQNNSSPANVYALDTGISINSVLPTGSLVSGANLNTSLAGLNQSILASSTLQSFLAANPAASDGWTLEAGQYNGGSPTTNSTNPNSKAPGAAKAIFTSAGGTVTPSNIGGTVLTSMETYLSSLNNEIVSGGLTPLQTSTENSTTVSFSTGAATKYGLWGAPDLAALGSSAVTLFGLTGNAGTGQVQSYILGSASLATNGTLTFKGNSTSPVPLPAAVWLFGSGLMGLVGVSRRRKAAV